MSDFSEALEEGTMCVIAGDRLRGLMGRYPQIAFKILEELSRRLERTEQLLENISLHSAERRLAAALLEMSEGSLEIRLSLSKGDLASQLGMTQETLSRRLTAFEGLGLIEQVGQRSIRLLDREELERIASGG
jgi:CRP/FNR family transcriptional regulator